MIWFKVHGIKQENIHRFHQALNQALEEKKRDGMQFCQTWVIWLSILNVLHQWKMKACLFSVRRAAFLMDHPSPQTVPDIG